MHMHKLLHFPALQFLINERITLFNVFNYKTINRLILAVRQLAIRTEKIQ